MKYLLMSMLLILGACGKKGNDGSDGVTTIIEVPAPEVVEPTPTPPTEEELELEAIQAVIDEENDSRLGLGQTKLSKGLSCTLQTIAGGHRIQPTGTSGVPTLTGKATVATFLLEKEFNQPDAPVSNGLNVLPAALKPIYTNMFYLSCTGFIVITESEFQSFEMSSDDAGLLYIGGSILIDNDNSHGIQTKSAVKFLRRGVHAIRIDFAQSGGGNQALIVKRNGELLSSKLFLH